MLVVAWLTSLFDVTTPDDNSDNELRNLLAASRALSHLISIIFRQRSA